MKMDFLPPLENDEEKLQNYKKCLTKRKDLANLAQTFALPTAIFASSDLITLGVLQALFEEGLSIPQDISLVAFDEIDFAPFLICPLTTVAQPKDIMGEFAVKLLVEQMKNPEKAEVKRIILKPKLQVRNSVRAIMPDRTPSNSLTHHRSN